MEKENKKVLYAILLALLACLIWASTYILSKKIANSVSPIEVSFWRWVIALAFLFPFAKPHFKTEWPKIKDNLRVYFYLGLLAACIYNILFFKAAHFTSANNLSILSTSSFIWTVLLAALLKVEKVSAIRIFGCIIAFVGVFEVVTKGSYENFIHMNLNIGDLMMMTACIAWGIYAVVLKKTPKDLNQIFMLFVIGGFGVITLTPIYLLQIYINGHSPLTINNAIAYLYVGIFVSAIAWYCYNRCINIIGPINTSMIFFLLPIFSAVMAWFILDEKLYFYHAVGFMLIVGGIFISNLKINNDITK